jgi:septal ring factor EnvC (AmiA/AmiB activator)
MGYSLAEAARASGKSKMTIQRAIKSGKISASRNEDGSYDIDPSELHRMFPLVSSDDDDRGNMVRGDTDNEINMLQLEIKVRDEKIASLQAERERERRILQEGVEDLRHRLDQSEEERRKTQAQLTALLTNQRQEAKKRRSSWLKRLLGGSHETESR